VRLVMLPVSVAEHSCGRKLENLPTGIRNPKTEAAKSSESRIRGRGSNELPKDLGRTKIGFYWFPIFVLRKFLGFLFLVMAPEGIPS
jgi:hypothetical protein